MDIENEVAEVALELMNQDPTGQISVGATKFDGKDAVQVIAYGNRQLRIQPRDYPIILIRSQRPVTAL